MSDSPKLLIYVSAVTPRINYTFRHICTHILGLKVKFTSKIEEFIAHEGMKLSYGKQKLGNELFIQSSGLLSEQGFTDVEVRVSKWENTVCFFRTSKESDLPFDIFAASFYMLSRYEEYLPHVKDEHGRYPSSESLAYRKKFLDQPVVDIWALKFKQILVNRFDYLEFPERHYSTKNILAVAEAYKYKKKGIVRSIGASIRDLFSLNMNMFLERIEVLLYLKNDPYDIYDELIHFSKQEDLEWYFMFQLSNYSINSKNVSYNKIKYHALIKSMGDYGKIGLLPGFEALSKFKTLKLEKNRWESIVNRPLKICLSHFFDINLPELYNNFDKLEIKEDFSMAFVDVPGFRAGTCSSFLFYDINFERISPLVIHPPALNSCAFDNYSFFEIKKRLETIQQNVKEVGGTLSVVYRNSDFEEVGNDKKIYNIVKMINKDE
ncbi:carbohydrate esterase [Mesonia sp.]|uniref:DUF7033 domain-containing protein n=1 Tax=Mesonia sp. TaxID=1960830 RepID=UPI00175D8555|nr:carbohydrate esterase [Mesonia sp.]HIB37016.1 carbohydrate esterase [Mesonia sp.]HIO27391.1 carbohydrate esterase [Flavobacteriaceae bacterium]